MPLDGVVISLPFLLWILFCDAPLFLAASQEAGAVTAAATLSQDDCACFLWSAAGQSRDLRRRTADVNIICLIAYTSGRHPLF